jgi:hypothetical protein
LTNNKPQVNRIAVFFVAVVIYATFAIYLYLPHLNHFASHRYLLIVAAVIGASGTYLLSTRWISSPIASFFAGLLYAFGPFTLGFALYHPTASMLPAILPLTLLPAAFWPHKPFRLAPLVTMILATLPFITIIVFFTAAAHYGLYPIPHNQKLQLTPYVGLLSPLMLKPLDFPYPGFYHVAVAPLIFGLFIFLRIHRLGAILFCVIGIILSLYAVIGQISPIVWATLPILCFSIIAGLGIGGLVVASGNDKNALAGCAVCMAVLTAVSAIIAYESNMSMLLLRAAGWYAASAFIVYLILRLAISERRAHVFRWTVLSILMAVDIFLSARAIIDKLF